MEAEEVNHAAIIIPVFVIASTVLLVRWQLLQPNYGHIPTIGLASFPFYFITAYQFVYSASTKLKDGYSRGYPMFKVVDFTRWNVVITGSQLIEELKTAPEDQISPVDTHPLLGLATDRNGYSAQTLSTKLTRSLPVVLSDMRDEVDAGLQDVVSRSHSGATRWSEVPVANALAEIVSRACNRVILGPQVCRSPELVALNQQFIYSTLCASLPSSLSSTLVNLFSGVSLQAKRLHSSLKSFIRQRQLQKPNQHPQEETYDLFTYLFSESLDTQDIANAILTLNLKAIPSCLFTLMTALHYLASSDPSTVKAMRREINEALGKAGWSMDALAQMVRVDSFLKETMRLSGFNALTMCRTALVPYTFSDGTRIPKGTFLSAACTATHLDERKYTSPSTFDAFRHVDADRRPKHLLATATPEFLAWGLGRGACPGRFFASAVMKLVLASVILGYDVRFVEETTEGPEVRWIGCKGVPDLETRMLFRRR